MPVIMALLIPASTSGAGTSEDELSRLLDGNILVKSEQTEDGLICNIIGNLEEATVEEFGRLIAEIPAGRQVVLEMSSVPYVDGAGLAALVSAVTRLHTGGGEVVLCAPRPPVRRLLRAANFSRVATVRNTLDELWD